MANYDAMSQASPLLHTHDDRTSEVAKVRPGARVETASLSKRLWDLDWSEHGPWQFGDVTVVSAPFEELQPFVAEHYAGIFETDRNPFFNEPFTEGKRRFLSMADTFLLLHEGRTIGYALGHPGDWSSYYVRNGAVLPEYRERRLSGFLMDALVAPLRAHGIQRMEGDCSPANTPMVRMMTQAGYVITGTNNSERWGTLLHFTKYLSEEANAAFMKQFCAMSFEHVAPRSDSINRRKP